MPSSVVFTQGHGAPPVETGSYRWRQVYVLNPYPFHADHKTVPSSAWATVAISQRLAVEEENLGGPALAPTQGRPRWFNLVPHSQFRTGSRGSPGQLWETTKLPDCGGPVIEMDWPEYFPARCCFRIHNLRPARCPGGGKMTRRALVVCHLTARLYLPLRHKWEFL